LEISKPFANATLIPIASCSPIIILSFVMKDGENFMDYQVGVILGSSFWLIMCASFILIFGSA
jgi:hypothetical protein